MKLNPPLDTQQPWVEEKTQPKRGRLDTTWYGFFVSIRNWVVENSQSGTTANRPTVNLYAGRMYFDESLGANGKPIWVDKAGTGWVLADGTAA